MFAATDLVPAKHIILGMALHHDYWSKLLIIILSRLGHSIASSQALERETKLVENILHAGDGSGTKPLVINRSKPFYFVADNNDLNEETLDGKGIMHCTNTIVVQQTLDGMETLSAPAHAHAEPLLPTCPSKKRKRCYCRSEALPDLVFATKANPVPMPAMAIIYNVRYYLTLSESARHIDFAWMLAWSNHNGDVAKQCLAMPAPNSAVQTVPAWWAFNALAPKSSVPPKSDIAYCPVINGSSTEMLTVYAILRKCLDRSESVGLGYTIIVFDQAIYAKAMDIVIKGPYEFSSDVLRLGAFHIAPSSQLLTSGLGMLA